jgi:hypothetical protein
LEGSILTQSAECTLIRLTFWQSCGDVGPGNDHGCPGVDGHETWFVTNPALGIQAVVIPLSEDVKHGSKGRDLRRQWPPLANFRCLPMVGRHFSSAPVSSSAGRLTHLILGAVLSKVTGTATAPARKLSDLSTFGWVEPAPPDCPSAGLPEHDGRSSRYLCGLQLEGLAECSLASQK